MARAVKSPKKAASPKKTKSPKARGEKKQKDPNAPKRGMSAYFLWLKEARASIAKPGMSVVDVTRAAGVEWGKLKDKTKWEEAAAKDKKRYEKEMAAYKMGGGGGSATQADVPKKASKSKAK